MTCQRIYQRIKKGLSKRGKPYKARNPRRTLDQRRAAKRHAYHEMTPEQRTLRREYARMLAEKRRRDRGAPVRQFKNRKTVVDDEPVPKLPARPFQEWLAIQVEQYGTSVVADWCEVLPNRVRELVSGQSTEVSLDFVDRTLVNEGSTQMWELYDQVA